MCWASAPKPGCRGSYTTADFFLLFSAFIVRGEGGGGGEGPVGIFFFFFFFLSLLWLTLKHLILRHVCHLGLIVSRRRSRRGQSSLAAPPLTIHSSWSASTPCTPRYISQRAERWGSAGGRGGVCRVGGGAGGRRTESGGPAPSQLRHIKSRIPARPK